MPTRKNDNKTTIWRLRVSRDLVRDIEKLAEAEQRSVTKQAAVLLQEALQHRQK